MKIIYAAWRQTIGDLRPNIFGFGILGILIPVLAIVGILYVLGNDPNGEAGGVSIRAWAMISSAVGMGGFIIAQISSETYVDRISGALVRVRLLPHGPLVWTLGKSLYTVTLVFIMQFFCIILGLLFFPELHLSVVSFLVLLLLMLLILLSLAPLGFLFATFLRGTISQILILGFTTALIATAGTFFPLTLLPRWLQLLHYCFPIFWGGHLARWAVFDSAIAEPGGQFHPFLGIGIMLAWAIIGFAVVPAVIRRTFRKESLGNLQKMQAAARSYSGL
ncbi:ABC transporter permease [Corynebacterium poyangense]|uniref:ABC transporter permease n=1 Tax=Corynebacterium poyangense TaxID=2684405 RepID=A0A7H0SR07_9CORY|nr:ABC transporter permease [Corynebacterium poyangense]MBZ8176402.1 ABC transporter permease [Corynebacterium poyangense]QNQ90982.1 ABC transporter permease [Corynebacterium poyangense]